MVNVADAGAGMGGGDALANKTDLGDGAGQIGVGAGDRGGLADGQDGVGQEENGRELVGGQDGTAQTEGDRSETKIKDAKEDREEDGLSRIKTAASVVGPRSKLQTGLIMASLMIAVLLAALDITIVTTALPTIAQHFETSQGDYAWIGSAYTLAAAASVPAWGKFSDIWGRKPILLLANSVFFVGSLVAALSFNIKMLLAARVVQGIGGGGLIVLANICVSDIFSERDRALGFGLIGFVWGFASAVGPILGGLLSERVSWRWCFYINLPFDGLAFVIIIFYFNVATPKTAVWAGLKAIDWIGVITISGGTTMFLLGLEYGGVAYSWTSATPICLIVFGLVTVGLFFVNEWKFAKYPIMPLRLFGLWSNVACFLLCFLHGAVFITGAYFLPLYFQTVLGTSAIKSGVYLLPFVLLLSASSVAAGVVIKKTGAYLPSIWVGVVLMTVGTGLFIDLPPNANFARIFPFQVVAGLGVGPLFQCPLIALQAQLPPRDIAAATALYGFLRNLATAISVVIGGVIFQNRMLTHRPQLLQTLDNDALAIALSNGASGAYTNVVNNLPPAQRLVVTNAYTNSLKIIWVYSVALAALAVVVSLFIKKKSLSTVHKEYKTGLAQEEKNRLDRIQSEARHKMEREERRKSKRESKSLV